LAVRRFLGPGWAFDGNLELYYRSRPPEDLFLFGVTLAFLFAVLIGVGAGIYPSVRASRMEVVSAIRYE
jgi:putative ABC transport system permease protein